MNFIIDILFLALIIFVIVGASRKGFVSTLLDTFSTAIAAIGSYILCSPLSEWIYSTLVRDLVRTRFLRVLDDANSGLSLYDKVTAMIDGLPPAAVNLAEAVGMDMNTLANSVFVTGSHTNEQLADLVVDKIGYDIMITIIQVLCFIALFIVFALLVRFISKFFENVNKIPFIGKINSLLGGVIGVVKAVIVLFFVCTIVFFIISASENNALVEAINNSRIYNFVIENNPVMDLLK